MRVLAADPSLYPVMEPDNEVRSAPAIWAKRRCGRFPVLQPGDTNDRYRRLWSWIMDGAPSGPRLDLTGPLLRAVRPSERRRFYQGRPAPLMRLAGVLGAHPGHRPVGELADQRLFVKTVYVPMSVEWLAAEFEIDVLVLLRHPGNVLASWVSLDLNDRYIPMDEDPKVRRWTQEMEIPLPGPDPLERLVWQLGVLNVALERAAQNNPTWVVRTHEALCVDPVSQFRQLYADLGLTWSDRAVQYLDSNNRPGEGFPTQRVASDQPDLWKSRLTGEQIDAMQRVLSSFPLATWSPQDLML